MAASTAPAPRLWRGSGIGHLRRRDESRREASSVHRARSSPGGGRRRRADATPLPTPDLRAPDARRQVLHEVVRATVLADQARDLALGVVHRRVVAPAEPLAD